MLITSLSLSIMFSIELHENVGIMPLMNYANNLKEDNNKDLSVELCLN